MSASSYREYQEDPLDYDPVGHYKFILPTGENNPENVEAELGQTLCMDRRVFAIVVNHNQDGDLLIAVAASMTKNEFVDMYLINKQYTCTFEAAPTHEKKSNWIVTDYGRHEFEFRVISGEKHIFREIFLQGQMEGDIVDFVLSKVEGGLYGYVDTALTKEQFSCKYLSNYNHDIYDMDRLSFEMVFGRVSCIQNLDTEGDPICCIHETSWYLPEEYEKMANSGTLKNMKKMVF